MKKLLDKLDLDITDAMSVSLAVICIIIGLFASSLFIGFGIGILIGVAITLILRQTKWYQSIKNFFTK